MATRRPLVLVNGIKSELPPGDTIPPSAVPSLSGSSGLAEIDFGVNGSDMASVFVVLNDAAISVSATSVSVGVRAMPSADHSLDEHLIEQLDVRAGNIVNGVGFEIFGVTRNVKLYGKYSVFWSWRN